MDNLAVYTIDTESIIPITSCMKSLIYLFHSTKLPVELKGLQDFVIGAYKISWFLQTTSLLFFGYNIILKFVTKSLTFLYIQCRKCLDKHLGFYITILLYIPQQSFSIIYAFKPIEHTH